MTKDDALVPVTTQVQDVSDLLLVGEGKHAARQRDDFVEELGSAIELAVDHNVGWVDDGGVGRWDIDTSGNLIVSSVPKAHDSIDRLLKTIRTATARAATTSKLTGAIPPSLPTPSEAEAEIASKLSKTLSVEFHATPLREVVEFLEKQSQIPMQVDRRALEVAGVDTAEPIQFRLKNARVDDILHAILEQVTLTFMVRDEMVVITTKDGADATTTVRLYPVPDFAPTENRDVVRDILDDLAGLIERHTAQPTPGWEPDGGIGRIVALPCAKSLVVKTTPRVHEEIEQWFAKLRAARGNRPVKVPVELRVTTHQYSLKLVFGFNAEKLSPAEAMSLVKARLGEIEFDPARHSIQIADGVVTFRVSNAVQRQLERILNLSGRGRTMGNNRRVGLF